MRFAVGRWTNFGQDHLDFHPDVAAYFEAKSRLFDGRCRTEVVNLDDPALAPLIGPDTVTFSAAGNPQATWYATDRTTSDGYAQQFLAHGPAGAVPAGVSRPGLHNVANALLAIAALTQVGVEPAVAAPGGGRLPGAPGRGRQWRRRGRCWGGDYAHKPDARGGVGGAAAVAAARGGRLICVLGAGGGDGMR